MKRALFPVAALLLLAGCQQPGPAVQRPYAPDEEGLTLAYMDPSLPQDQQQDRRLQVRVEKVLDDGNGGLIVTKSYTTGMRVPLRLETRLSHGSVALLTTEPKGQATLLPEGFPESVSTWSTPRATYRIVGRGAWTMGAKVLPADRSTEGVWVEARAVTGEVWRTLYLPGLGEVQSDALLPNGQWQVVNLLTQYGFTDPPVTPKDEAAPERPAKPRKHSKPKKA